MAALGCTRGLSARLSKDYAQPECLGAGTGGSAKGCGKKRTAHFSAIHERDGSRARTTDFAGRKKTCVYVRPVRNDGDMGERTRWKQSGTVDRSWRRRHAAMVAGRPMGCVRRVG